MMLNLTLDWNINPSRLEIYSHPSGCVLQYVLNSLQALSPSLSQYSRAMLGCYLKISQRNASLWSRARAHWSNLQTPPRPRSSFSFQLRMKRCWTEKKRDEEREGRREGSTLSGLLWHLAFFFFFFPAGHLFPVCNLTPVPNWVLLPLRCVCASVRIVGLWFPAILIHQVIYVVTN